MTHWTLRLLRHRLLDAADAKRLLGAGAAQRIQTRVAASERHHRGQIRVCIEAGLPLGDLRRGAGARERAVGMFGQLGVWDTAANNGVLIYLLLAERAIEIVADRGVAVHVDSDEWQQILTTMGGAFRDGRFEAGLMQAIGAVDAVLVRHFPRDAGGEASNELPDAPVFR